jgi:hypothetical protein
MGLLTAVAQCGVTDRLGIILFKPIAETVILYAT